MPLMKDRGYNFGLIYDIFEMLYWYVHNAPDSRKEYVSPEEYRQLKMILVAEGHTLESANEWLQRWVEST